MKSIKHILFPFDFSEAGFDAAPFVRSLAKRWDAKVSVLTVFPPTWNAAPGGVLPLTGIDAPEEELQARQDQALAHEFTGLMTCRVTDLGEPARKIIDFAHSRDVDVIMMPTHGLTGYRSMLLGSVTVKVLHEARQPVWTATHAEEQGISAEPHKILCAIDDTPGTLNLMHWASEFSQRMQAELCFLHVAPIVSDKSDIQSDLVQATLAKLKAMQQSAWIPGCLQVAGGAIAETIREHAQGAHLLIIGRGLLSSPLGRLRSNAYAIVHQSPCPVLSV